MKDDQIQMPFGLNENNALVHISEVQKGYQCNCKCLSCGTALIATKGPERAHHFRHYSITDCNGESIIHKAAKHIILEKMQITLPNGNRINLDSARDEVHLPEMTPDILAMVGNNQIIIEIYYTHRVDEDKQEKIQRANISAIEIKLSDLKTEDITNTDSFWLYINDPTRVTWLYQAPAETHKKFEAKETSETHRPRQDIMITWGIPRDIIKLLQRPMPRRKPSRRL